MMVEYTDNEEIVFLDTEVNPDTKKVEDIGAVRVKLPVISTDGFQFRSGSIAELEYFLKGATFICGHNIIKFDLRYIISTVEVAGVRSVIDTLYLSPLLFPKKPYHNLLKDDKIQSEDLNNPLNDAKKAMELFLDEVTAFNSLLPSMKKIYCTLLEMIPEFRGFFRYVNYHEKSQDINNEIKMEFHGLLCENADIENIAKRTPVELAYCLAIIATRDRESIIPYWVQKMYPGVQDVYKLLRGVPCDMGCEYCKNEFNIHTQLKKKFGYENFRTYAGEPLQEAAVDAAVHGKSLLAIFPTGGGKSITFQLPALMAAEATQGLTVVISPLQSLMKDQVDNLNRQGITDAVTINGLLNIIERMEAIERIENGIASILYISPESLRSKTIERLLLGRNIERFVIDEAHCFSAWGQDFRVDYLYIGDFIAQLQEKKCVKIPVSCFTATAKQKVISDIKEYFKKKLDIELELFTTNATRTNLRYEVLYRENDQDKYITLRNLIEQKNCPTIVYASRTKKTMELAQKLHRDGFNAKAFHGKMESDEKIANQEAFIRGDVQIIVATSAFGMGVDKKDVKLVIHYDISDSLENYVQEAGRAGRDENIQAECYVLFNENDLDKHFILLNQTKLSINEIQQVWKGIKDLTKGRSRVCCSELEIARQAGWDDTVHDIETKVKTAISALETAGYIKRGQNCPRVYADSIQVKNASEAVERINTSSKFNDRQKEYAIRIIKKLISARSRSKVDAEEAESRVDYIADHLAIAKQEVIECINLMREAGILANEKEMSVYVDSSSIKNHSRNNTLRKYSALEGFLIERLCEEGQKINYKVINEEAQNAGLKFSTVNSLRILLHFWIIKGYIKKPEGEVNNGMTLVPQNEIALLKNRYTKRVELAKFLEQYFISKAGEKTELNNKDSVLVNFSIQELQRAYSEKGQGATLYEVEEALLYLSKINAFRLEGGFLVLYNAMEILRLEMDNKKRYKVEDYRQLKEFYNNKTQQIHIVGEYANMMVRNYEAALIFVNDYFQMEYKLFLSKYFKGARLSEIDRNITPIKYEMLFAGLSAMQSEIISDDESKVIVVAAGPGSGKTKVLVHKLASLMLLEDVKHEQLLMLTFSRAAAMEFKMRLIELIGNAAYFIDIKTFHSYCFDLLGKIGNINSSDTVVRDAAEIIKNQEVELDRITKTVLVLDEAQDMSEDECELVKVLMERNEDMRVIMVGDDDQNIYEFRGSDSKYMASFLEITGGRKYELVENYRSCRGVVEFANSFVKTISGRLKLNEIRAVKEEKGEVFLIQVDTVLEKSIVSVINQTLPREIGEETVAVLTNTNEEAYLVAELLRQQGYRVRLLQSNEGFSLYDLAEIRYFLEQIKVKDMPVITEEIWSRAKGQLAKEYSTSDNLRNCISLLEQFEKISPKKYYTDVEEYLREARLEDFYSCEKNEICISTIHKSKGREFDRVYMLFSEQNNLSDEEKRKMYVGITRARNKLYVCYNKDYFALKREEISKCGVKWRHDTNIYSKPEEVVLTMSHKDIFLGYYTDDKYSDIAGKLRSGEKLQIRWENSAIAKIGFYVKINGVMQKIGVSSKKFSEELCKQRKKGYVPCDAKVLFVVKWRSQNTDGEDSKECNIVLPLIRFKKNKV